MNLDIFLFGGIYLIFKPFIFASIKSEAGHFLFVNAQTIQHLEGGVRIF